MASYYKDVREYLQALDERDKLFRIQKQINKDTQLMPLMCSQFRGLEEEKRLGNQEASQLGVMGGGVLGSCNTPVFQHSS